MTLDDTLWCLRMFSMMAIKGTWGVPRSGLVFQKTSVDPPTLELIAVMPYATEMQEAGIKGAKELREFQHSDLDVIKRKFKIAGITVEGDVSALS